MRCDEHEAADPMVLMTTRVDRRDRSPVTVADQQATLKANGFEHTRQYLARLIVHIRERPRQPDGTRLAVPGARIDEYAGSRRSRKLVRKIVPKPDTAEAFVQQNKRGRFVGPRSDEAVFQLLRADGEKTGVREFCHRPLLTRRPEVRAKRASKNDGRLSFEGRAARSHLRMTQPCPLFSFCS